MSPQKAALERRTVCRSGLLLLAGAGAAGPAAAARSAFLSAAERGLAEELAAALVGPDGVPRLVEALDGLMFEQAVRSRQAELRRLLADFGAQGRPRSETRRVFVENDLGDQAPWVRDLVLALHRLSHSENGPLARIPGQEAAPALALADARVWAI